MIQTAAIERIIERIGSPISLSNFTGGIYDELRTLNDENALNAARFKRKKTRGGPSPDLAHNTFAPH